MSNIRRQSIISSGIVYIGFALGFLNTYLFTREGSGLTKEQFGLTGLFIAFASIMFSVASLGMPAYLAKFFPYYQTHVKEKENDQLTWALIIPCLGFGVVLLAGLFFKNTIVDGVFDNSPQLLQYYYWTFPFGFGYTLFMIAEAYAWQRREAVRSNFLREIAFRLCTTVLIVSITFGLLRNFDAFIAIYAFTYLGLAAYLLLHFGRKGQLHFTLKKSTVTKKFFPKILALSGMLWGAGLVLNIASVFDTIIIAAVMPNGIGFAGIFTLAQNVSSLMQAPQRAIISAAVGPLSESWKNKDHRRISKIYHHSSINQLLFALLMFGLIWLSFDDMITSFRLQVDYRAAKWVFFFLGLAKIVDMGTGVNAQIIATSTYWRFDMISGLILLSLAIPLNWQLTRHLGIIGPAVSNLIAFSFYNGLRYFFLWRKFRMQPFTWNTLLALLIGLAGYLLTYYLFRDFSGIEWIVIRSLFFGALFMTGVVLLKLSPDLQPVLATVKKRLGLRV